MLCCSTGFTERLFAPPLSGCHRHGSSLDDDFRNSKRCVTSMNGSGLKTQAERIAGHTQPGGNKSHQSADAYTAGLTVRLVVSCCFFKSLSRVCFYKDIKMLMTTTIRFLQAACLKITELSSPPVGYQHISGASVLPRNRQLMHG